MTSDLPSPLPDLPSPPELPSQPDLLPQLRDHDIVLVGATGYAGRLVAAYLARQAPEGLRIALAGRSEDRLQRLRAELPAPAATWPLLVVDVTEPAQVSRLAGSVRVVATTVGPYARYGLPLARACADAGTSYADLTGEALFVRDVIDACHDTAVRTGARLVTACGFDSVPSDLGVHLLHHEARRPSAGGLGDTTLLVTRLRGEVSGGSVATMRAQLDAVRADPARRRLLADPFVLAPDGTTGPDASGQRDLWRVFRDAQTARWTAPWVMGPFNSRVVRRSDSLLGHAYGPRFRYREAVGFGPGVGGRLRAYGLAAGLTAVTAAMGSRTMRPVVDRLLPAAGEGPTAHVRGSGAFRMEVRTTTDDGLRLLSVVAADLDPGYAATAVMLGESALCLALDEPRLSKDGGVLTPAVAMGDALVDRLRSAGFVLTVGPDG